MVRARAATKPRPTDRADGAKSQNRSLMGPSAAPTCARAFAHVSLCPIPDSGGRGLSQALALGDDLDLSVEVESQQAAVRDAADPLRPDDHRHVVLARQDGGVAEPAADLADEAAGAAEIGQPVGIDHRRDDDVAVLEVAGNRPALGIALGDDVGAAFDRPAARHARAADGAVLVVRAGGLAARRGLERRDCQRRTERLLPAKARDLLPTLQGDLALRGAVASTNRRDLVEGE